MREHDIEKYLIDRGKALGGEVRKVKWIGRGGAPDRLVMLPWAFAGGVCRTIWVELKATGKKAEPHQEREHKRMRDKGQRVEVVDSIERVEEILSRRYCREAFPHDYPGRDGRYSARGSGRTLRL